MSTVATGGRAMWVGVAVAMVALVATSGASEVGAQEAGRAMMIAEAGPAELDDRGRAIHLLQRATFGPRPEDIDEVLVLGIDGWLDWQLDPAAIRDPSLEEVAGRFPGAVSSMEELLGTYPPQQLTQPLRLLSQDENLTEEQRATVRRQLQGTNPNVLLNDLVGARLYRSAYSERQLEEVMTQFWFDHFNVYFRKNRVNYLVGGYEADAIRPHVFGSFSDMLAATASHPAMLYYLDNAQSVSPDSSLAAERLQELSSQFGNIGARLGRSGAGGGRGGAFPRRTGAGGRLGAGASYEEMLLDSLRILQGQQSQAARQGRGLNENYARELLELHSLGVDGGYTQDDVIQVARAFTGWGVNPPAVGGAQGRRGQGGRAEQLRAAALNGTLDLTALTAGVDLSDANTFAFRPFLHDAKEKVVLGQTIPAGGGMEDGLAVIDIVASHPSTARFIATQLVTRFVSDQPPESLVEHIATVFTESDGDLGAVTRALFTADEFYAPEHVRGRVKSPFTLVASAVRLTGAEIAVVRPIIQQLTALGEVPYMADAPTGYPEESSVWVSSGAMLNRMNLGLDMASGQLRGIRMNGGRLAREFATEGVDPLAGLAAHLLPGADLDSLLVTIREELARAAAEGTEMDEPVGRRAGAPQLNAALGLILGSPEFQRH